MINKELLKEHYNNILIKNREKILKGGVKDNFELNEKIMSMDLLIRIPSNISNNIENCLNKLKEIESDNIYYYPPSDFHISLINILKGEIGRTVPENINEYINCINECIKQIKPFEIEFNGLTASDNAVLVKGYYDNELQKMRELLRENLVKKNLIFEERYKTISSHITIARIKNKLKNPEKYISFIENGNYLGKMKVESIELTFHNWYDTKKEILANFHLS